MKVVQETWSTQEKIIVKLLLILCMPSWYWFGDRFSGWKMLDAWHHGNLKFGSGPLKMTCCASVFHSSCSGHSTWALKNSCFFAVVEVTAQMSVIWRGDLGDNKISEKMTGSRSLKVIEAEWNEDRLYVNVEGDKLVISLCILPQKDYRQNSVQFRLNWGSDCEKINQRWRS